MKQLNVSRQIYGSFLRACAADALLTGLDSIPNRKFVGHCERLGFWSGQRTTGTDYISVVQTYAGLVECGQGTDSLCELSLRLVHTLCPLVPSDVLDRGNHGCCSIEKDAIGLVSIALK